MLSERRVQALWMLLQGTIGGLVVASDIRWKWAPDPRVPLVMGVWIAYGATLGLTRIGVRLLERRRDQRRRRQQRAPRQILPGLPRE